MPILLDQNDSSIVLGAAILSVLAFPERKRHGDQVAGAMTRGAAAIMANDPAQFGRMPETARLLLSGVDQTQDERRIRWAARIISNERLIAAKAAWPEIHAHIADALTIPRPALIPTHCSREMVAALTLDLENLQRPRDGRGRKAAPGTGGDSGNVIKQTWLPSLSTLHMALALQAALAQHPAFAGRDGVNLGDILFDHPLCCWLIRQSEIIRPIVAEKFGLRQQAQISMCFQPPEWLELEQL